VKPFVKELKQGHNAVGNSFQSNSLKAQGDKSSTGKKSAGGEAKSTRRIYSRKFMIRMWRLCQGTVDRDSENPLTTSLGVLSTAPRPEIKTPATAAPLQSPPLSHELRADAPEFVLPPAGDEGGVTFGADGELFQMSADVPAWPFEAWPDEAGGLVEESYWPTDAANLYVPESKSSITGKASTRSSGSTMCTSKNDGSELEDLESTTTAQSVPASPAPQPAPVPSTAARDLQVRTQIEYYFSLKNMAKDWYLRSLMDVEGWISLDDIMQFPKTLQLCMTSKEAAAALVGSPIVEVTWDSPPRARLRNAEHRATFPRVELELDSAFTGCFNSFEQPLEEALADSMYGVPAPASAKQPNNSGNGTTVNRKKPGKKGTGAAANQSGYSQRQGDKNWKKGNSSPNTKQSPKVQSN